MKVVVCIKQTPSTTAVLVVDGSGNVSWDDPGGKPNVLNPWDEYTVEEGVRLKENHGATDVIALTVGPEESQDALKTCLAMGCTEAVLVSDPALQGLDSLGTARALAAAIEKAGEVQVAIFGRQAIDGDTGQTPVQVARKLGWTPLTFVSAIKEMGDGQITVERLLDDGKETVTASLPVVISTVKEINEPRYPSLMGIRKANRATIPAWSAPRPIWGWMAAPAAARWIGPRSTPSRRARAAWKSLRQIRSKRRPRSWPTSCLRRR